MSKKIILVSACLVNIPCRYNGSIAEHRLPPKDIARLGGHIVPVCPEQLGGLPTPRKPVEIQYGDGFDVLNGTSRVVTREGEDFTDFFIKGAEIVLAIAKMTGAGEMITQPRSPSCSSERIYTGDFRRHLTPGFGVCAAMLKLNGLKTIDLNALTP